MKIGPERDLGPVCVLAESGLGYLDLINRRVSASGSEPEYRCGSLRSFIEKVQAWG